MNIRKSLIIIRFNEEPVIKLREELENYLLKVQNEATFTNLFVSQHKMKIILN